MQMNQKTPWANAYEGRIFKRLPVACRRKYIFCLFIAMSCMLLFSTCLDAQSNAQKLFSEAMAARAAGNLNLAEQKYLEVTRLVPGNANAYENLGIVYVMEMKYRNAVDVLKKAILLEPKLAGAHVMLGLSYYELYDPHNAVRAFHSALRLNPNDKNALLYMARSQIQIRDYKGAVATLEKASKLEPSNPDVVYCLGLSYMKLMLEAVNRLGVIAPKSYQFFLLLAQDAEARDDDRAAITDYRQALEVQPRAIGVHYALGNAYARVGQYDRAADEFKTELKFNPDDPLALWKLGLLALRTNPQEARKFLGRAILLKPDFAPAVVADGRALALLGHTSEAVVKFRKAERLDPNEDSVHYLLANAYRRLGQLKESEKEMARFKELAKLKSERTKEEASELIELTRFAEKANATESGTRRGDE